MSIYEEAPAADPRALLSAAALGSIAGLVLGGGYLLLGRVGAAAPPPVPARLFTTAATPSVSSPAVQNVRSDRPPPALSTPLPTVSPRWLHFAAPPFRVAVRADTDRDRQCLTQAVYYEARGEAALGQEAVAQVVLNRVRHPAFPKSVCGVVFQRSGADCQFSFACESHAAVGRDAAAWRRAETVADQALDGFVMRQVGGATHFHVSNLGATWSQGLARIAQIGAHVFYGLTGRSDAASPWSKAPALQEARLSPPSEIPAGDDAKAIDTPRVHLIPASAPMETKTLDLAAFPANSAAPHIESSAPVPAPATAKTPDALATAAVANSDVAR